eukprot:Pompholyxophrys_punicea_v1_NODE_623_length_1577_cov_3.890276.p3 type:complete len:181 gc:universal NODE_623_length_1577_cov_3.890276:632-90(-)
MSCPCKIQDFFCSLGSWEPELDKWKCVHKNVFQDFGFWQSFVLKSDPGIVATAQQTRTDESRTRIFFSLRFGEAMSAAKLLKKELENRFEHIEVFICEVTSGSNIKMTVVKALTACHLAVIFGTETYGTGTVNFSTFEEMEYILNYKKPYFLLKMCEEFKVDVTKFNFLSMIALSVVKLD